jgi:uracil-DNA glycosylase
MPPEVTLWDYVKYLDSVRDLYPRGIPEVCLREAASQPAAAPARAAGLLFVALRDRECAPFEGPEGELLSAALEKGMKLGREGVRVVNVAAASDPAGRAAAAAKLQAVLESAQPSLIVGLGAEVLSYLGLSGGDPRGRWGEWRGVALMPTHGLGDVLKSSVLKKEFWADLQQVMIRLANEG